MPKSSRGPTRPEAKSHPAGGARGSPVPPGEFLLNLMGSLIHSAQYRTGERDLYLMLAKEGVEMYAQYVSLCALFAGVVEAQEPVEPVEQPDSTEVVVTVTDGPASVI
jgi:hypothetical protein